jgi:transcriptional regulator with PAS, ATPase and Fis domain
MGISEKNQIEARGSILRMNHGSTDAYHEAPEEVLNLPAIRQFSVQELIDRNIDEHHRSLEEMMDRFRNTIIVRVLGKTKGNISQSAKVLRVSRLTLTNWMDRYNAKDREEI